MKTIILRTVAGIFDFFMSFSVSLSFCIYAYKKQIKFFKPFCFGALVYLIKFIVFNIFLIGCSEFKMFTKEFGEYPIYYYFYVFLYHFLVALYILVSRIFIFSFFMKKDKDIFGKGASFAVGFCSLYNFVNCTIVCIFQFGSFLDMRARYIILDAFDNVFVIFADVGYTLVVLYILNKKTKIKYFLFPILLIIDTLTCFFSEIIILYVRNFLIGKVFSIMVSLVYLVIALILRKHFKNKLVSNI